MSAPGPGPRGNWGWKLAGRNVRLKYRYLRGLSAGPEGCIVDRSPTRLQSIRKDIAPFLRDVDRIRRGRSLVSLFSFGFSVYTVGVEPPIDAEKSAGHEVG